MNKKEYAAKYLSDIFLINVTEKIQVLNKDGESILKPGAPYAAFVHEYWHYLLNLSTTARFRDFTIWHNLYPIFSKTLMEHANGESNGDKDLDESDKQTLDELFNIIIAYAGDSLDEKVDGGEIIDFKFVGEAEIKKSDLKLKGKEVPIKVVSIPVEIQTASECEKNMYVIGNRSIEESIANEIELLIDINSEGEKNAMFPYFTLRKLSEFYFEDTLSPIELIGIGTLSLLTTDPAYSLIELFKTYKKVKSDKLSLKENLNQLSQNVLKDLKSLKEKLFEELESITEIYREREPLDDSFKYLENKFKSLLDLRFSDPFFDISPFLDTPYNTDKLSKLIFNICLPCDMIQEFKLDDDENDFCRDTLASFDNNMHSWNKSGLSPSYLTQIIQCQLSYFKAHWSIWTIQTSEIAEDVCPFYYTCNLEIRKNDFNTCKTKPWKRFVEGENCCVYGNAVANFIGKTKLKK